MAEKTGFSLDTKDFDIKFPRVINKEIPEAAAATAYKVAGMVIRDAILEEPRAPHDTGHLWRSQKIERPRIERGEITIELGFDVSYAARLHEAPSNWNWKLPGSGPKFLETKLLRRRDDYMKAIADGIKDKAK